MATYFGEVHQVAIAQEVIDDHAVSSADGRCLACGVPGPCYRRETAAVVFRRFLRLPRRTPGRTRPELVGARRIAVRARHGEPADMPDIGDPIRRPRWPTWG